MSNEATSQQASSPGLQPRPPLCWVNSPRPLSLQEYECFIGVSAHVAELKQFVTVQATQQQPVLLIGERGLRQEQIARALHQASKHWAQPFFTIDVHSLSSDALHQLLFGPGGMIRSCQRGTIYLDELANLPLPLQRQCAIYLEEWRRRARSGSAEGPRLVLATQWHPKASRAEKCLSASLIELLPQASFVLKPLRQRSEDIPYLASYLVERIARRLNKGRYEVSPAAMRVLTEYWWENNIDELESVLESALNCAPPHSIDEELLPLRIRRAALASIPESGIDLPRIVENYERQLIKTALRQTNGNQTRAARLLGLRLQTLNEKIKRFNERQKAKEP